MAVSTSAPLAAGGLRRFQQATCERAAEALLSGSAASRFLVADEVGLGKTRVALGLVRELEQRRRRSRSGTIVIYVTSNSEIANQNVRVLRLGAEPTVRPPFADHAAAARAQGDTRAWTPRARVHARNIAAPAPRTRDEAGACPHPEAAPTTVADRHRQRCPGGLPRHSRPWKARTPKVAEADRLSSLGRGAAEPAGRSTHRGPLPESGGSRARPETQVPSTQARMPQRPHSARSSQAQ